VSAPLAPVRAARSLDRLGVYLAEMYPVPQRAAAALLVALGLTIPVARLHGVESSALSPATLLSAWAVFTFLLVLRLMDELKDVEVDRALFPERPVPSGRVLESDLSAALVVVVGLFLGAHLVAGAALGTAVFVLAYALLMSRWFFIPERMRPDLPLTLATHTPVIPLLLLHLVATFAAVNGLPLGGLRWSAVLPLVASLWAGFFAWEIARKIRAPEEETGYVTYSRLRGMKGSVALAAAAQTLSLGLGLWLGARHGFPPAFVVPAVGGYLIALGGHLRFLSAPGPATSRLRPSAEAQVFGLLLGGALV
jgi:4-hydroxybenzoate polyprenyltransferase